MIMTTNQPSRKPLYLTHLEQHPLNRLFSRTTWVRWHQKGKPFWILVEQEMMGWGGSGISWTICKSFAPDNHASISPLSFYRPDALPTTRPTASKHWRQFNTFRNYIMRIIILLFDYFTCLHLLSEQPSSPLHTQSQLCQLIQQTSPSPRYYWTALDRVDPHTSSASRLLYCSQQTTRYAVDPFTT